MRVLVLGAGAYGLALANILSDKNDVTVYSVIKDEIDELNKSYSNEKLFPGVKLSSNIVFSYDIDPSFFDVVVIAIPINFIKSTLSNFIGRFRDDVHFVIASKGINDKTFEFSYDIVSKMFNNNISIIAGPSFAIDTVKREKIILTLAGSNLDSIKDIFPSYINISVTSDIIGVQVCSTIKNIFAIACGVISGLGVSESTNASFLTKIVSDSSDIIKSFGGLDDTIFTSAGIGDIILTCSSVKSRNYSLGKMIGEGKNSIEIDEYLKNTTVEGYIALKALKIIFDLNNISNELIDVIYDVVINYQSPTLLLDYLLK